MESVFLRLNFKQGPLFVLLPPHKITRTPLALHLLMGVPGVIDVAALIALLSSNSAVLTQAELPNFTINPAVLSASSSPPSQTPQPLPRPLSCGVERPPQPGSGCYDHPDAWCAAEAPANTDTPHSIAPPTTVSVPCTRTSTCQPRRASASRSERPPCARLKFVFWQPQHEVADHVDTPPYSHPNPYLPAVPCQPTFTAPPAFAFHPLSCPDKAYCTDPPPAPVQFLSIPVTSSLCIRTHDTISTSDIQPNAMHSSHPTHRVIDKQELVDDITCKWRECGQHMARGVCRDHVRTDHLQHEESLTRCFWGHCNGRTYKRLMKHIIRTHLKLIHVPCPRCGTSHRQDSIARHLESCMACARCGTKFASDWEESLHLCSGDKKAPAGEAGKW
ncbi:hypothetical protein A0H81_01737 [Grifola frondosa]|uniref:C2H2-type domain-containing protein n=1 Tax=Grifola frondosa TaxID=5627 RepID=A0A1C7MMK9_GRIFR|nr:hypothetical protein A0H81_01737 [Grifola frondosa]